MNKPLPFAPAAPVGGHVLGQPFTITRCYVPTNLTLTCNCGGEQTTVEIVGSVSEECPSCHTVYNAAFNPMQNKLEMQMAKPEPSKES